jgi:hypothetical protein
MLSWLKTICNEKNHGPKNSDCLVKETIIDKAAKFCSYLQCSDAQQQILAMKNKVTAHTTIIEQEDLIRPILENMYYQLLFSDYDPNKKDWLSIFRQAHSQRVQLIQALPTELAGQMMRAATFTELQNMSKNRIEEFIAETEQAHAENSLFGYLGLTESRLVKCLTNFIARLDALEEVQSNTGATIFAAN